MQELQKSIQASQELLGAYESFKAKTKQVYNQKLISGELYSKLCSCLRDIYCVVHAELISQERQFERAGGRFYEAEQSGTKGMFIHERR
ncbi:hypothetical protein D1872_156600 [compost metagenome]